MALTKVSGSILKDPLNLGEVSIGGTLTYEDVTNVDSLGIGTFRTGINVSGGQVDIGNNVKIGNAGIGTFAGINLGDNEKINLGASNDFKIYHNTVANTTSPPNHLYPNSNYIDAVAAGNLFIRTSTAGIYLGRTDGAHAASFHTNTAGVVLYYNASGGGGEKFRTTNTGVSVTGIVTASSRVSLGNNTTNAVDLEFGTNRGSAGDTLANINWKWNNTNVAQIRGMAGSDTTNKDDAHLVFYTSASGSLNERLRIDSSGFIKHKFTSNNSTVAEGLFINNLNNGTGNNASLIFSNDSGERKKASISYIDTGNYGTGDMVFCLDNDADSGELHVTNHERLRITKDAKFGVNQNSPQYTMHMSPAVGDSRIDIHMTNSTTGHNNNDGVQFGYQNSAGAYIWNFENTDIYFGTNNNSRLYIRASTGHLEPHSDNSQNLGSSSARWANIYTGDLQLSNKGKTNDVDGTWGNYTIQEGESDLFLINNRSGKKYKFNLTEVV